jgi:hypothetical protein
VLLRVHGELSYKLSGRGGYAKATVNDRITSAGVLAPVFYSAVGAALVGFGLFFDHAVALDSSRALTALDQDLAREGASPDVERASRWIVDSRDHAGLPFVLVDKVRGRLFAFDSSGHLRASTWIMPDAKPGERPSIQPPSGRFVAPTWQSMRDDAIVWVRGAQVIALYESTQTAPAALASLRVPAAFYRDYLKPLRRQASIAYVLPELALPDWASADRGPVPQTLFISWPARPS